MRTVVNTITGSNDNTTDTLSAAAGGFVVGGIAFASLTAFFAYLIHEHKMHQMLTRGFFTIKDEDLSIKVPSRGQEKEKVLSLKANYIHRTKGFTEALRNINQEYASAFETELENACFGKKSISEGYTQLDRLDIAVRKSAFTDDKETGALELVQMRFDAYFEEKEHRADEYTAMTAFLQNILYLMRNYFESISEIPGNDTTVKLESLKASVIKFIKKLPESQMFQHHGWVKSEKRETLLKNLESDMEIVLDDFISKQKKITMVTASEKKRKKILSKQQLVMEALGRSFSLRISDIQPGGFLMVLTKEGKSSISVEGEDNRYNDNELYPQMFKHHAAMAYLYYDNNVVKPADIDYFNDLMNMGGNKEFDSTNCNEVNLPTLAKLESEKKNLHSLDNDLYKESVRGCHKDVDRMLKYLNMAAAMQADLTKRLDQNGWRGLISTGEFDFRLSLIDMFNKRANEIFEKNIISNDYLREYLKRDSTVVGLLTQDADSTLNQIWNWAHKKFTGDSAHFLSEADIGKSEENLEAEVELGYEVKYKPLVLNLSESSKFNIKELRKISDAHGNAPIIIKRGKEISIYGFSNGKWSITQNLDASKFSNIEFPIAVDSIHHHLKLYDITITNEMRDEITAKKGHTTGMLVNELEHFRCFLASRVKERQIEAINNEFQTKERMEAKSPVSSFTISNEYLNNIAFAVQDDEDLKEKIREKFKYIDKTSINYKLNSAIEAIEALRLITEDNEQNVLSFTFKEGERGGRMQGGRTGGIYIPGQKYVAVTVGNTTSEYSPAFITFLESAQEKFNFFKIVDNKFIIKPFNAKNKIELNDMLKAIHAFRNQYIKSNNITDIKHDPILMKLDFYSGILEILHKSFDNSDLELQKIVNEQQRLMYESKIEGIQNDFDIKRARLQAAANDLREQIDEYQSANKDVINTFFEDSTALFSSLSQTISEQTERYSAVLNSVDTEFTQSVTHSFDEISGEFDGLLEKQQKLYSSIGEVINASKEGNQLASFSAENNKILLGHIASQFKMIREEVPKTINNMMSELSNNIEAIIEHQKKKELEAQQKIEALTKEHEAAQEKNTQIEKELAARNETYEKSKAESDSALQSLNASNAKLKNELTQITQLSESNKDISTEVDTRLNNLLETAKKMIDIESNKTYLEIKASVAQRLEAQKQKTGFTIEREAEINDITNQHNKLIATIEVANATAQKIITELTEIIQLNHSVLGNYDSVITAVNSIDSILEKQKSDIESLTIQVRELQAALEASKRENALLSKKLYEQQEKELQQARAQLHEDINVRQSLTSINQKLVQSQELAISNLNSQLLENHRKLEEKTSELELSRKELLAKQAIIEERNASIENIKAENENALRELKQNEVNQNNLVQEMTAASNRQREIKLRLQTKGLPQKEIEQLEQEHQTLDTRISQIENENTAKIPAVKRLREFIDSNQKQIDIIESDAASKLEQLKSQHEAEMSNLKEDMRVKQIEIANNAKQLKEAIESNQNTSQLKSQLEQKLLQTESNIGKLEEKNLQLQNEIDRQKSQIDKSEENAAHLMKEKQVLDENYKDLLKASKNRMINEAKRSMANAQLSFVQISSTLNAKCEQINNELTLKIAQSKNELLELDLQLSQIGHEISNLNNQLESENPQLTRNQATIANQNLAECRIQCQDILKTVINNNQIRIKGTDKLTFIIKLYNKMHDKQNPMTEREYFNSFKAMLIIFLQNQDGNARFRKAHTTIGEDFIQTLNHCAPVNKFDAMKNLLFSSTNEITYSELAGKLQSDNAAIEIAKKAMGNDPIQNDFKYFNSSSRLTVDCRFKSVRNPAIATLNTTLTGTEETAAKQKEFDTKLQNLREQRDAKIQSRSSLESMKLEKQTTQSELTQQSQTATEAISKITALQNSIQEKIQRLSETNNSNPFNSELFIPSIANQLEQYQIKLTNLISSMNSVPMENTLEELQKISAKIDQLSSNYDAISAKLKQLEADFANISNTNSVKREFEALKQELTNTNQDLPPEAIINKLDQIAQKQMQLKNMPEPVMDAGTEHLQSQSLFAKQTPSKPTINTSILIEKIDRISLLIPQDNINAPTNPFAQAPTNPFADPSTSDRIKIDGFRSELKGQDPITETRLSEIDDALNKIEDKYKKLTAAKTL